MLHFIMSYWWWHIDNSTVVAQHFITLICLWYTEAGSQCPVFINTYYAATGLYITLLVFKLLSISCCRNWVHIHIDCDEKQLRHGTMKIKHYRFKRNPFCRLYSIRSLHLGIHKSQSSLWKDIKQNERIETVILMVWFVDFILITH